MITEEKVFNTKNKILLDDLEKKNAIWKNNHGPNFMESMKAIEALNELEIAEKKLLTFHRKAGSRKEIK